VSWEPRLLGAVLRNDAEALFYEAPPGRLVFCPNDKGMLRPVNGVLTCPKCGYEKQAVAGQNVIKAKSVDDVKKSVMEDSANRVSLLPTTNEYACEKCGHSEAYYYMRQTRSADEATTRFLECTKCGYKWREYR